MALELQEYLMTQLSELVSKEESRSKCSSTEVRIYNFNSIVNIIYLMPIIRFKRTVNNVLYFYLCYKTFFFL